MTDHRIRSEAKVHFASLSKADSSQRMKPIEDMDIDQCPDKLMR